MQITKFPSNHAPLENLDTSKNKISDELTKGIDERKEKEVLPLSTSEVVNNTENDGVSESAQTDFMSPDMRACWRASYFNRRPPRSSEIADNLTNLRNYKQSEVQKQVVGGLILEETTLLTNSGSSKDEESCCSQM